MNIEYTSNGVVFSVNLESKVNIIFDDSGTGKSFFFETLKDYCKLKNIDYSFFNYQTSNTKNKLINVKDDELVIMDNADLYLTRDILNELKTGKCIIILSIKNFHNIGLRDSTLYTVDYTENRFTLRRL